MATRWVSTLQASMLVVVQAMAGGCTATRNTGPGEALIGTWSCRSLARTTSTMQFSRAANGSIVMTNRYTTLARETGEFDESYSFDPINKVWTWNTTDSLTGSKEEGTAGLWIGRTWTFDGTRVMRSGSRQKIQMIYTRLNDREFRREFIVSRGDTSHATSSSLCKLTAD